MSIAFLKPKKESRSNRKRKGRGNASGLGGECGRGHKGQKSRSGFSRMAGFEGGQMPLYRRIPKTNGFNNHLFKTIYDIVNLDDLNQFEDNAEVSIDDLLIKNLVSGKLPVKILGFGTLEKKLTVTAHAFSKSAEQAIVNLKGSCIRIDNHESSS